jgi:hypothetical protein
MGYAGLQNNRQASDYSALPQRPFGLFDIIDRPYRAHLQAIDADEEW